MQNKTLAEMIGELYAVTIGVPGSDDRGIVGDVRQIKKDLKELNGAVKTNTAWRKAFCFIIPAIASGLGFVAGAVFL